MNAQLARTKRQLIPTHIKRQGAPLRILRRATGYWPDIYIEIIIITRSIGCLHYANSFHIYYMPYFKNYSLSIQTFQQIENKENNFFNFNQINFFIQLTILIRKQHISRNKRFKRGIYKINMLQTNINVFSKESGKFMNNNKVPKQEKAHIKLNISTWNKDSHGLYDYQSTVESYKNQNVKIQNTTIIYRDAATPRTILVPKNQPRQMRECFSPIANIVFQKKQGKTTPTFRFEPVQSTNADITNYDTTRTFYKVIREKNPESPANQFALKPGHIVKMGRVEYMVIQMKNNKQTLSIRDTNHFNENNGVFQFTQLGAKAEQEGNQIRCKVCLCSEETVEDPLISPCQCKGTLLKIHVGCLRQWINSKVKKQINDIATSYNFTKFECQICKCPFPKIIKVEGKQIEMMTISKPAKPYIILESLNRTGELAKQERCLHLISAKQNSQIRIGRGHQCEIRLTDISVSRAHAKIIFANDQFLIKDERSKFGTLIKFEGNHTFQPQKIFRIQYGRTLFQFELCVPPEDDTDEQDDEQNQLEKQPTQQAE